MKQVTINLYSFNELGEQSKQTAIFEHGNFLESVGQDYEDDNGEFQMDYTRPDDDEIKENILANEYVYFESGELAQCVTYCGNHPKSGITELTFHGRIYEI